MYSQMKYIYPFFLLLYLYGMLFLHGKNTAVLPQIGDQGNHGQDQRSIDQNLFHNHKSTTKVRDQDDDHKHLADGFALMVNAGADWSQPVDIYTLGTGARCYFNTTGVYIGGGLDWERRRYKGGGHNNDWGLGIEAGYAYFLSRTVTIEPAVYYKWRFDDSDNSRFGIKVGFGFYF